MDIYSFFGRLGRIKFFLKNYGNFRESVAKVKALISKEFILFERVNISKRVYFSMTYLILRGLRAGFSNDIFNWSLIDFFDEAEDERLKMRGWKSGVGGSFNSPSRFSWRTFCISNIPPIPKTKQAFFYALGLLLPKKCEIKNILIGW